MVSQVSAVDSQGAILSASDTGFGIWDLGELSKVKTDGMWKKRKQGRGVLTNP